MPVEMLTYAALAEGLKISPEAARARHRLPQSRSNDSGVAEIEHKPLFGRRVDALAMKACIDSLQRELAKVEAMAAAHRADFERERDRSGRLMAELLKAVADAMAAKESTALRLRPWWRRLAG
jgi:hypothetical protein